MGNSYNSLLDVSGTMLITLYARARESLSRNPIIIDTKAVEMINIIKKEIVNSQDPVHKKILNDKYNKLLAASMALRSRRFDKYTLDFLAKYPEGTVINIGCGLDTRWSSQAHFHVNGMLRFARHSFKEEGKGRIIN